MLDRLPIEEDPQTLQNFSASFADVLSSIERHIISLESDTANKAILNDLFTDVARLFQEVTSINIPPLVEPVEVIKDAIKLISEKQLHCASFWEMCLILFDRLSDLSHQATEDKSVEFYLIQEVQDAITPLTQFSNEAELNASSQQALNILLNHFHVPNDETTPGIELFEHSSHIKTEQNSPLSMTINDDDYLLRLLANLIDQRHRFWRGRTKFLLSMALGMNAMAGNRVDFNDLKNAIYLHDFPMTELSDDILYKPKLSTEDFDLIRQHPVKAYEIAIASAQSENCARMVYQHHERIDGRGYPEGLTGDQICDGAKVLAICDAFHAMTHLQAHRASRKTILRAISEINSRRDKQFDAFWVDNFNLVIRTERLGGAL